MQDLLIDHVAGVSAPPLVRRNISNCASPAFQHSVVTGVTFRSIIMSVKQQKLVLAIIEFLTDAIQDGTVKQDDREGVEVAGLSPVLLLYFF